MKTSRRVILNAVTLASAAAAAKVSADVLGSTSLDAKVRVKRIAVEEGFSIPELGAAISKYLQTQTDEPGYHAFRASRYNPIKGVDWQQCQNDIGDLRLKHMDEAGIDVALLLSHSPGVQLFSPDQGTELATLVNDRVAAACAAHPGRLYALAAIAPQAPDRAAQELERAVKKLGLKGGLINSHTKGEYLDEPKFAPILEAAQAMDVPIYIHPREPAPAMIGSFLPPAMLAGATWGYAAETGLHAVRLIAAGIFDRFPKLRIVLGHLGEGIPYFMDRLDLRWSREEVPARAKLKKKPSDYFKSNFVISSSGMNWGPAVRFCQQVLGAEKVLFAADYPFEDAPEAVQLAEAIPMSAAERELFFHKNAERVFNL